LGIDPNAHGGLVEKPEHHPPVKSPVRLSDASPDSHHLPPDSPEGLLKVSELTYPDWLQMYLDWAVTPVGKVSGLLVSFMRFW
jgi:hypothetical protein